MTTTETERPAIIAGQRFRVNSDRPEGAQITAGTTVEAVDRGRGIRFQTIGADDRPEGREWIIYPIHLDPLPTTVTVAEAFVPVTITQEQYDAVVRERDEARAQNIADRQQQRSYRESVANDLVVINEVFSSAAERNDLCGVYDEAVSTANIRMSVLHIDEREVDYTVSWQETYTVTVTRSDSFTGMRNDDDGNLERAEECRDNAEPLNEYSLIELLRENGNHEFDDYVDDSMEYEQS